MNALNESSSDSLTNALLDQFEELWSDQDSPPDLLEFCHGLPHAGRLPSRLLADLARIDIDYCWRRTVDKERRRLNWYVERLMPLGLETADVEAIALEEWITRSFWGDQPASGELVDEQFPEWPQLRRTALMRSYIRELDQRFPLLVNVSIGVNHLFREALVSPCEVGRQRSNEPEPPTFLLGTGGAPNRLVVLNRRDNSISRQQVLVNRVAINAVDVTGLSSNVATRVVNDRLLDGGTGRYVIHSLGLEIRFQNVILHIRRV